MAKSDLLDCCQSKMLLDLKRDSRGELWKKHGRVFLNRRIIAAEDKEKII